MKLRKKRKKYKAIKKLDELEEYQTLPIEERTLEIYITEKLKQYL